MADVSRGTDQSNTERSLTKKGLSFEQSIRLASTASQEMGTAQPGQEARSSTSETDPRVAFREAFTSLQDIHNILPKDLLGNQGKYEACKRAFGRFMDAFDHSDQTARSKYADDLCKQIEDLINVLNTMEQKIDTMEQKIGESANIRAFTQGKLQKLDEIVTQSKGSSIHKHRSDQHKRAQSFCSDIDASKSILDKKGGLENLLMVVQRSCFQLYDTREQFQDYLQTLAHLQQNVAKIEDYLTQKDGALWPPFQAQTSQMHGSEETTTRLKKSDIREQLRSYDRPDVVFEERKATKYDRAKRSLRDKDTRIEYLRQDDEHMKQLYRDLLKEERQARADLWQRRTTLEFYLMEKALVSQHQFQAQPPQIHGTGELIISFFNQFTPEAKAAYQWASNNKNLQNPRLPIQVLRDADQCLMRSHTDVLGKELETRYPGFKDLWSTHREGLLFLFPDKADPLVDQIVQNNLEPTQRVHHPRWEKQKQRLGRTDELLRAIETVRPLLENFHQLYRYLSSENPDHILSNLDKLSQDSGWMAKLQDAFDPQHFSGFWERLQHIYGNLRALESSNRDYQKPNDDSEWLMKKLEECKQRETQLRESIGSVKDLIYRNRRKVRNYLKRQDAFPEEFIRDLRSEEAKCRERQNDPAIRGNVQVPLADLQKRYNDLDAASKVLDRTLETYEERWLHGAREILREIDHTLKQCRGYVQLEDEGILPQESEMGGVILIDLDLMCHYWVNRYRTALEEACIECHGFIEEETTVQDLLESVGRRFEEISPTEQRDSPISPQTHLDKLEGANQHLMTMLRVWQRSALGQMKIPEDDIANAQESLTKAKEYQPEHPDTIMAKEFMDCLEEMEKSVQAASKYSKYSGQDLVSIVNNPERPNDITELCWALKIKASREKLEKALEMTQTSERDSLSKEHERDSKTPHLEVARKKLKELEAIHIKLEKIWENHETQIKQDSSPEALDNFYTQLGTSYEKVDGQQMWLETCDDLVKVEQEKKQLTETLEAWRNKYKWQPNLEKLHTTYEQVLQYFAKGPSHTPDQILGYVEDFSQISLIGKVIQKRFGPEPFHVFCQYLRTLSDYVKKDPATQEYLVQAIPKPRLIQNKFLALHDTLSQLKETAYLVKQIQADLRDDNPTDEELDQYLSSQLQKYRYKCIELYQHSTDDGIKIGLHHSYEARQENIPLLSSQEEDNELVRYRLEKKVEIVAYAQKLGHSYFNCHSFTFTDGKGGWFTSYQVEIILNNKANGFKNVWKGNIITDPDHLAPDVVQPGDVIVYRQRENGEFVHSGYVLEIKNGKIIIKSKWGGRGIYKHEISAVDPSYGPYYEIYHTDRPEGRLLNRAKQPSVRAWIRQLVPPEAYDKGDAPTQETDLLGPKRSNTQETDLAGPTRSSTITTDPGDERGRFSRSGTMDTQLTVPDDEIDAMPTIKEGGSSQGEEPAEMLYERPGSATREEVIDLSNLPTEGGSSALDAEWVDALVQKAVEKALADSFSGDQGPEVLLPQGIEKMLKDAIKSAKENNDIIDEKVLLLFPDIFEKKLLLNCSTSFSEVSNLYHDIQVFMRHLNQNLDKLNERQMYEASGRLTEQSRELSRNFEKIKPYIDLIHGIRTAKELEKEYDQFIKDIPAINYLGYQRFKKALDDLNGKIKSMPLEQSTEQVSQNLRVLTDKYTELSACFNELTIEIDTRKEIDEALKGNGTLKLLDSINRYLKWQRQDLFEIKEHQTFQTFMELYKMFNKQFNKTKLQWQSEQTADSTCQALESLYNEYVKLSNSFENLVADTQKLRSESKLTFDKLRERLSLSLCLSEHAKEDFEKASQEFWPFLYTCLKSDITKKYPDIQTPEGYRTAVAQKAADLVEHTDVWARYQLGTLQKILKSGRFKSQFETNTSGGAINPEKRAKLEKSAFDYPEDLDWTLRPIYGYITDDCNGKAENVEQYGTAVAIRFKDSIKQRTTITMGDSLESIVTTDWKMARRPAPYTNLDEGVFATLSLKGLEEELNDINEDNSILYEKYNPLNYSSIHDVKPFVEAQMHGGVSIADIAEIVITNPDEHLDEELTKMLDHYGKEYGFTWRVSERAEIVLKLDINIKPDIERALKEEPFSPKALIGLLKQNSYLKEQYEGDTGVWEGYKLEEHTEMLMGQFEKYFATNWNNPEQWVEDAAPLTKDEFRLMLAVSDIGKPAAVKETGRTSDQHEYTRRLVPSILKALDIPEKKASLILSLATQDYIGGDYLQRQQQPEEVAKHIAEEAQHLGMPKEDYFQLVTTYFMCDAGAYTADAEYSDAEGEKRKGQASLDDLFLFHRDADGNPTTMSFSRDTRVEFDRLADHISELRLNLDWVGSTLFAIGGSFSLEQIEVLKDQGVAGIVDMCMCEEDQDRDQIAEHLQRAGIKRLHLPTPDHGISSIEQLMEGATWVNEYLDKGKRVLIRCAQGIGRSVIQSCAVLMKRYGINAEEALKQISEYRVIANPNYVQIEQLEEFGKQLDVPPVS